MIYKEVETDLFSFDKDPRFLEGSAWYVQCISSDLAMGAGISIDFNIRFDIRRKLIEKYKGQIPEVGNTIYVPKVPIFNLVTKYKYFDKPTYEDFQYSLWSLKDLAAHAKAEVLYMPKIGCGLDKLTWSRVSKLIKNTFKDTDIEIVVATKKPDLI